MTTLETISQYQILETIGKGAFGTVKSAIRLTDQRKVAIKFISKTHLKNNKSRIQSEINIHASLNNIHIVRLYRVFADKEFIYLVMELLESDLFNFISKNGPLNEHSLVPILTDLIKGLEYLHAQNIIHRDLKLSNMLLTRDKKLKVADFGLAVRITSAEQKTMCGTPNYLSPEIVNRIPYGLATDMWSLGCMIVTMLTGSPPFQSSIVKTTLEKVVDQEYICPSHFSTRISDLIGSLLQKDPSKRPLITDLLKHPFFTPRISRIDSGLVMNDSLSSSRGSERYSRGPSPVVDSDRLYGTESRSSSHLKSSVNDERRLDSRGSTPPNVLSSQKQHSDSRSSTPHARKYNVEIATPASQPSSHYIDSRASLPYTSKSVPVSRETTPTHSNNFNFDSSTSTPQQNAYYNDSRASTPQAFNSRPPSVQGNHVMDPRSIIQPNENLKPPSAYRESNIDSQKKFFSSSTITSKDNGSNRSTLINSWHSKSLNETRPLNSKPPPIPKLEELKPFSTARLKPISQTTKYGIVKIEDDGRVCLDFKDEKYIFSVSSNSESVCLLDKLDLSVKFRFETRSLHDSLHKKYQYAARFVDLIASKTVKIVYYSLIAKCTFMENQPPNSTISFKNGDLVVIDVRNGKISITLSGELFVIGLNNGVVPDKCSSIFKHARECLVKCLEIEGKSSKFPITVRADESKNLDTCCTRVFLDRIGWCCKFSGQLGGDLYIVLFDDGASLEIESKLKTLVYKIASVEERYTIDRDLPLHVKERLNAFPKFIKMF